jgi:hypothetical protein
LAYPRVGQAIGVDRILYLLHLIGEPGIGPIVGDWPPTTTTIVKANTWELSTQGVADDVSCSGSGTFAQFGGATVVAEACLVGSSAACVLPPPPP